MTPTNDPKLPATEPTGAERGAGGADDGMNLAIDAASESAAAADADRVLPMPPAGPESGGGAAAGGEGGGETSADRAKVDLMLLRRAAGGDGRAFGLLVDRHGKSLFRLAYLLLGSAADAEDVLQEAWTGAFKSLRRFEGRSSVRTWLTRILTTQVALWRRKKRGGTGRVGVISLDASPQAAADSLPADEPSASRGSDWQADLDAALRRLTVDHREVIVLREIEGLSYDEIADSLKVPRGTVESRLHRARGELRKLLTDYVHEK